jgi:hypothetical protein
MMAQRQTVPNRLLRVLIGTLALLGLRTALWGGDPTWNYAVEITATVSAAPPWTITLT